MSWAFCLPSRILFGQSCSERVGDEIVALGEKHALLVSDPGVVKAGLIRPVLKSLSAAGVCTTVFGKVKPKPPASDVDAAVREALRAGGVGAVVGLGGGSAMDVAKVTAASLGCGVEAEDFLGPSGCSVSHRMPLLLVPTTAGTGSEVTPFSVLMDADGREHVVRDRGLMADVAVVDPRMTLTLPAGLTAASGTDALAHAVESYTGRSATYLTDTLAMRAVEAIASGLPEAVEHGDNLGARTDVMLGSLLAGASFANTYNTLAHALAGSICSTHPIPHALAVASVLPWVEEFNYPAAGEKLAQVARLLGAHQVDEATDVGDALRGFIKRVGAPYGLAAEGVGHEETRALALKALDAKLLVNNNPRKATPQDVELILESVLGWT